MSSKKKNYLIWLIPLLAVLFVIAFAVFTRFMVGKEDSQNWDYYIEDHVPGASPHSTGPDSR
jgi:hypothetical protein